MFWAKKIYCRCYQQIFHIAIPFLPYRKPKILQGIAELPTLLHKKKITSLLLVTDASIRSFGLTAPLEKLLADEGIECIVYDKTVANPTTVNVAEALELYKENNCEALIGFGGGSSIDCAKAAGARIARPGKELSDMEETQLLKEIEKSGRDLTLRFGLESVVITGVEVSGSDGRARMGNLVLEKEKADWCFSVKEGGSYSGTGDLLASVLSAGMVRGIPMKACVEKAVEFLGGAIHDAVEEGTDRNDGVCFEKYLGILTQI